MRILRLFHLLRFQALFVLLACISYDANSQMNVKIGYSLGFVSPEVNNQILTAYNEQRALPFDQYTPFDELKFMYGIALGARYKFGIGAVELNWESLSRTRSSTGISRPPAPASLTSDTKEFKYALNMLMLTYESNFGIIGVGSSIGNNLVSIKEAVPNSSGKFSFLNNENGNSTRSQLFARFHLSFNFTGNGTVAFAIKPYIQLPLSDIDLKPMADALGVQNDKYNESFPMYGLSFSFYNGRQ